MDNINEKYPDLYRIKENSYGSLETNCPVVVFLDGIGVTKKHKKYNMLDKDGFIHKLSKSAYKMMSMMNMDCISYTSMDEVSFVFHDSLRFIDYFRMDNVLSYIEAVFLQKFCRIFHKYYPEVDFKITIFNIKEEDIDTWFQYRKEISICNAEVYIGKEFLPKYPWKTMSSKDILNLLKQKKLYEEVLLKNKQLYYGILQKYHPADMLSTISMQI